MAKYQRIVIDSREDLNRDSRGHILDYKGEPIIVWCKTGRGKSLRMKKVSLSICLKYSKQQHSTYPNLLYLNCRGCTIWHEYLERTKEPESQKPRWTKIVVEQEYKKIKVKKKYKRIKI